MDDEELAALGFEADDDAPAGLDFQEDASEVPQNYAPTGARVLELPETTVEGTPEGTGSVTMADRPATEYQIIDKQWETDETAANPNPQPPGADRDTRSAGERLYEYLRRGRSPFQADPARYVEGDPLALGEVGSVDLFNPLGSLVGQGRSQLAGRELPSLPSIRRAIATDGDMSDRLSALLPAANTDEPIIGPDVRALGPLTGATAPVRWVYDNLARATGSDALADQDQALADLVTEQAPNEVAAGEALTVGGLTAPISAPSMLGRAALAGLTGAVTGGLRSGAGGGDIEDVAMAAGLEGALAGGMSGAADAASSVGAPMLSALAERSQSPALRDVWNQAGLEARGIYGRRAMERAQGMPGGVEQVARNLDDLDVPLDPRRAARHLSQLQAESGPRVGQLARQIRAQQDAGRALMTDMRGPAEQAEQLAAGVEHGAGMGPAANHLRTQVRDQWLAQAEARPGGMPFFEEVPEPGGGTRIGGLWGEDINLRELAGDASQQGLGRVRGRLNAARRVVSNELGNIADSAGLGADWRDARRSHAILMDLDDISGGDYRRNVQGGMGGAFSRGSGFGRVAQGLSNAAPGDVVAGLGEAVIAPFAQQEARFRLPGMQYRAIQRVIQSGPQFERAARALRGAQMRGGAAVAAAHALLMRSDPIYRRAIQAAESEAPEGEE